MMKNLIIRTYGPTKSKHRFNRALDCLSQIKNVAVKANLHWAVNRKPIL